MVWWYDISDSIALTRFRLSNYDLMIEKERHLDISCVTQRNRLFFPGETENELHILLDWKKHILNWDKYFLIK